MNTEDIAKFLLFTKNHVPLEYIVFGAVSYLNIGVFWARFYYATMKNRSMIMGTNVSCWDCDSHYNAKITAYISLFLWPAFLALFLLAYLINSIGLVIKILVINDTKEEEDSFSKKKPNYRCF